MKDFGLYPVASLGFSKGGFWFYKKFSLELVKDQKSILKETCSLQEKKPSRFVTDIYLGDVLITNSYSREFATLDLSL